MLKKSENLVVGVSGGNPVYLRDVANVRDGAPPPSNLRCLVWQAADEHSGFAEYPAITMSITKKPGQNAIDVADSV